MGKCAEDGKCVVDVVHDDTHNSDFASFLDISIAAEKVLQWCVDAPKEPSEGGYIGRVGT